MKKKLCSLGLVASLLFAVGCDVPWTTVGAVAAAATGDPALAIAVASIADNNNNDQNWWDRNDQHFDWHFFPFN